MPIVNDFFKFSYEGFRLQMTRKYDMTYRAAKKRYRDLRLALEDLEAKKKQAAKPKLSRAERRRLEREAVLPKDRKCPVCDRVKLKSAQWQAFEGTMLCVGCARRLRAGGSL